MQPNDNPPPIPNFLRRNQQEPIMKQHAELTEHQMRDRAKVLTADIEGIDAEIKTLSNEKATKNKELRAITGKLVTLTLRKS